FERARGGDGAAAAVAALVGRRRNVPMDQLLHRSRCKPEIAEARMLAMYLTHVMLGRTYSEVGQFFGRDRTTVAHACARIEDMRDAPGFEDEVSAFEAAIGAIDADGRERRHAAG
ncbi:MAG: helix-turn-helix domain-containing protein, partial [Devosia sp.]